MAVEGATIIESFAYKFFDELWVVKLDRKEAVERIKVRNPHLSIVEIQERLSR